MIIDTINNIPNIYVYLILSISLIVESFPILGIIIPGMTIVMLSGFAVQLGYLNIWLAMLFASIGAIIGDITAYFVGRKYGMDFIKKYGKYLLIKEEYIIKTESFIKNHLGKSTILGRFNPVTRVFVPFLIGVHKSSFIRFLISDIFGGVIWASCLVLIGFIFGQSYKVAEKIFGNIASLALLVIIFIGLAYYYIAIKKKYLSKKELTLVILLILSITIFFNVFSDIKENGFWTSADSIISSIIEKIHTNYGILIAEILDFIFDFKMMVIISLGVIILLWFLKLKREAVFFSSVIIFEAVLVYLLKILVHRPRPENALLDMADFSFPSGHTTIAVVFFGVLAYIMYKEKFKFREISYILLAIIVSAVGFSRIYLNVHYLSDVIGSFALGIFIISSSIIVKTFWEKRLYVKEIN